MFAANTYVIRQARDEDATALRRIAELDSQSPLAGRALIGEVDGRPAAAMSLDDGRVIADPFQATAKLTPLMRMRARAIAAYERTPSLEKRVRAGIRVRGVWYARA